MVMCSTGCFPTDVSTGIRRRLSVGSFGSCSAAAFNIVTKSKNRIRGSIVFTIWLFDGVEDSPDWRGESVEGVAKALYFVQTPSRFGR